jgi:hypothetical protein
MLANGRWDLTRRFKGLIGSHMTDMQQYSQDLRTMAVFISVCEVHVTKWEETSRKSKMFLTDWWGVRGNHRLEVGVRRYGHGARIEVEGWTKQHFGRNCGQNLRRQ